MRTNMLLLNYKGLSEEELKKLPVEELARVAHEALQNWDKLNQRLRAYPRINALLASLKSYTEEIKM